MAILRRAYQLNPTGERAFRFGREGLEQESSAENFSSDSLFSAIVSTAYKTLTKSELQHWFGELPNSPIITPSSVFPCLGGIPLFPKPALRFNLSDALQEGVAKSLKKLQYVSAAVLSDILQQRDLSHHWNADHKLTIKAGNGKALLSDREYQQLPDELKKDDAQWWQVGSVSRVSLDRRTSQSNIYQVGRVVFQEGCGLWFMLDLEESFVPPFERILAIIGDEGIGGERSSGWGGFTWEALDLPTIDTPTAPNALYLLSRYHPTPAEIAAGVLEEPASYELVDIGGRLTSVGQASKERARVRMLEAGSVVNIAGGLPQGDIVDVRPEHFPHPIWRAGCVMGYSTLVKQAVSV
ncbi:MAG: type III-A CRISPR-associated RAMP protein Csm4 [Phototrophicaceae bacterium]